MLVPMHGGACGGVAVGERERSLACQRDDPIDCRAECGRYLPALDAGESLPGAGGLVPVSAQARHGLEIRREYDRPLAVSLRELHRRVHPAGAPNESTLAHR
jgi:hypothetical protein